MTPKEQRDYEQMYRALKRITKYQTTDQMRRSSDRDWGLPYEECLGMAYENIQGEAKTALKGVRKPQVTS